MKRRYACASVICLVLSARGEAQGRNPRSVQPERPTVATHAGTVVPGYLEVEWGITEDAAATIAPLYFKLGLRPRAQLGISVPLNLDGGGAGAVGVAVKWRVADDAPLLGRFAFQPSVTLPHAGTGAEVGLLAISSHQFGQVAFDANAGYFATDAGSHGLWTLSFGGPLSGRVGWVGELSGVETSGSASHALLFGPTFSIRNWFALDAGASVSLDGSHHTSWFFGGVTNFGRLVGR